MERCLQMGARIMFLEVATDNSSAQLLYQAFGFVEVGKREGYYLRPDGTRMSAYTMRCDLANTELPKPRLQSVRR
jgi:ribosomal-protein-alanine N-acetyltransferase